MGTHPRLNSTMYNVAGRCATSSQRLTRRTLRLRQWPGLAFRKRTSSGKLRWPFPSPYDLRNKHPASQQTRVCFACCGHDGRLPGLVHGHVCSSAALQHELLGLNHANVHCSHVPSLLRTPHLILPRAQG